MATLEKPKQKKKKKVRTSSVAEETAETVQWSNADIEFPSTSTSDEIEIISQPDDETICKLLSALPIASDTVHSPNQTSNLDENISTFQSTEVTTAPDVENETEAEAEVETDVHVSEKEESVNSDENTKETVKLTETPEITRETVPNETIQHTVKEATSNVVAPSAPEFEDFDVPQADQPLANLLYPNLKTVQSHDLVANSLQTKERIILKPFTNEQLKELYNNPELHMAEAFESDFINTELNNTHKDHPLYELIKKYSHSRYNLKVNMLDLHGYIKCFQENSQKVWIIENRITSYEGVCADGERVRKNELFEFAVLNEQTFQKLSSNLNTTLQLVCYSFMTNLYACESYRTQIEQCIRELLSHSAFSSIRTSTPIALNKTLSSDVLEAMREIRVTISVLFSFLRRQVPDKEFSNDIKKWLEKLAAYYVRTATWQDHLFLIYHILRCPPGVASWATSLIQIPKTKPDETAPFASDEINHCVTFLKVLLMPTKQRAEFLANLYAENGTIDATAEDLWIIIDSDGEEDNTPSGEVARLKETDLIALLNQVPFENLFKSMTFITMNGDYKRVNKKLLSGYHLMKFIAFSTNLVELLGEGLKTYANEKYRQFAKLISRLVRHTVQYVSDMHSIFKENDSMKDEQLWARIQIEFDIFVMRASNYIYLSRFLGAWQYLAILPFSELHITTTWKLYYMLTSGFSTDLIENVTDDFRVKASQSAFLDQFNDIVTDVPAEDMYYLLQTFASMALSREIHDLDFIRCVTTDLFKVGFINALTRDSCYKIVRDLLVNITSKHTVLISDLLQLLKENFKVIDKYGPGPYLFKSLPLDEWRPPMEVFEISANWLLNFHFESRESVMARTIFSRLNWNFDKNTGELFLPFEIHVRMASLIVDVSSKHAPETIGSSGISESVRQMSNLVKGQTPHQQFSMWCWNMVSVLRLHSFDQNAEFIRRAIRNPMDVLRFVHELDRLPSIAQGVSENRPIAVYISLLTTLLGHSVPQICHKGFAQMQNLLNDYRYSSVIRCLQLVTPFFLDCPESLCKCAAFQSILTSILQADRTYIRMAKDFISCDYPGPVVELFSNMIQAQIIDYYNFDLQSPVMLVSLWLNCLTVNPAWYKDPNSLYIVDVILRIAFQFTDAWITAKNFFKFFCKAHNEPKSNVSSTFIPFLGGSQPSGFFSVHSAATPWLALLSLEIEHEMFELETKLWPEIIRQLHATSTKFSMDNVIKNSAKSVGCAPCSTNSLVLYKLANLILSLPPQEELLPIFCQKFFHLYLTRIRFTADEERFTDVYGVADKFYDTNIPLMKKLKKFFIECVNYEKERSMKSDDQNLSDFYSVRSRLYGSFELWLEETRLNKILHLRPESFPPAYDLNRLAFIFANNCTFWTEFIQLSKVRQIQRDAADAWLRNCLRYVNTSKQTTATSKIAKIVDPADNIVRLLDTYDAPIIPPIVPNEPLLVKKMSVTELKRNVLRQMQNDFKKIDELSRVFHMDVQELSSLDATYKEMLRMLHENKSRQERREVRCGSLISSKCKGGVYVNINMPYHEINEVISNKLATNRDRHEELINKLISAPTLAQILPIVQIQFSIKRLLESYRFFKHMNDEPQLKEITTIANTFFYYMINAINENINSFHPAQDLCTVVLSQIGVFLQENQNTEGMNLLKTALKRPDLIKPISDLFVPSATIPEIFLQLYKFIIDSHLKNCDPKILFVLLSKFDVSSWLTAHKPKLADINQLVQLILQGLECWNKNESALIQGLLRRHLIHIFMHDFPEHYGEVLLMVLKGCSENKLMPSILLEILNTIYKLANCPEMDANTDPSKMKEDILYFATNQKLFSYRDLYETIGLFARHFQNERLQHGLNGLYPIHKDYCKWMSAMFETFGHSLIVSAVHANPGALSDTLIDWIWPSVCEMFSPWLFPYYPQNLPNLPANWIRQFNTPILLPWSELYSHYSQMMLHSFINCIQFMLDTFPACDLILSNIFYWYESNFGNVAVPRHVLLPTNSSLILLPWNRLKPTPLNITGFHRLLQQYLPDCHSFLGHIFLRVNWTPWLYSNIHHWDYATRCRILSTLLLMFVKLSYEPTVRENMHLLTLLQEAIAFPWYMLDYRGIEGTFDWFVMSTEPSSILCLSSEHSAVDNSILSLLQTASSIITPETEHSQPPSQLQAKRILYVKSIVRLLRLCGSKYQQLLTTQDGLKSFHSAIFNLLSLINGVVTKENEMDGIHMMNEIVGSIQLQGEFTSRIFVEAIAMWQAGSETGNLVVSTTLNALGTCKSFSNNIFMLMETTVFHYFRFLDAKKDSHTPSWPNVVERLGPSLPTFDLQQMFDGEHLLCIYISMIYKLKELRESGERITYLQNIGKLLENYKSTLNTESKLVIIWALLIMCGSTLLETNSNAREPLQTLARHLKSTSNVSDGWGEGLLGAIGLKKETVSNRRKIIAKCLACIIFSLFLGSENQQKEFDQAFEDLKSSVKSKKFADIRTTAAASIDIVEKQSKSTSNTKENICAVIRLFYTDCFLMSLEEIWTF